MKYLTIGFVLFIGVPSLAGECEVRKNLSHIPGHYEVIGTIKDGEVRKNLSHVPGDVNIIGSYTEGCTPEDLSSALVFFNTFFNELQL